MYLCKINFQHAEMAAIPDEAVAILSIYRPAVLYLSQIHAKLIGLDIMSS
jgi:hypothetical protein